MAAAGCVDKKGDGKRLVRRKEKRVASWGYWLNDRFQEGLNEKSVLYG